MTGSRDIAVAILAGGQGSRIGGRKPDLMLAGQSLMERAIGSAQGWSDTIVHSVRSPDQLRQSGLPIITDDAGIEGPLAGLAAALAWAAGEGRERLLTIPCDMPLLPADLALRLEGALGERSAAVASSGGRLHPICALWQSSLAGDISGYLATGRRSLHGFAAHVDFAEVEWPAGPPDPFFNINTAEDLAEAGRILGG